MVETCQNIVHRSRWVGLSVFATNFDNEAREPVIQMLHSRLLQQFFRTLLRNTLIALFTPRQKHSDSPTSRFSCVRRNVPLANLSHRCWRMRRCKTDFLSPAALRQLSFVSRQAAANAGRYHSIPNQRTTAHRDKMILNTWSAQR